LTETPSASVVVVSFRNLEILAQGLDSLRPQCARLGAELVLVRRGLEPGAPLTDIATGCRVIPAPADANVPRLRGIGLAQARGEWVALTEDHCVADPGWLDALLMASGSDVQVLGGSMGNAKRDRATDCGAFFSEYGFFGANGSEPSAGGPPLVTGANVAYHRSVVAKVAAWARDGSWENVIHERLHAAGHRFRLVPAARVRQNLSYRLGQFCRDRFEHGRDYAATRARGLPLWRRAALMAATPLLPALLAARVARLVDPEERRQFQRALPMTLTFLAAWSIGEAVGYARGSGAS
jgi:GT2 family glycosyltransferase